MSFTDGDKKLLLAVITHMRNAPDVDFDQVASVMGFKNANVARTRYGQVKRKLQAGQTNASHTSPPASSSKLAATKDTPKTPSKSAGKRKSASDNIDTTPTKTVKKEVTEDEEKKEGFVIDDTDLYE